MAKKKKQKSAPDTSAAAVSREPPVASKQAEPSSIERAFAVGNNAAVRRMAREGGGPEAARLLSLVKVEPVQLVVGLAALLFMVVVALMVLRTG